MGGLADKIGSFEECKQHALQLRAAGHAVMIRRFVPETQAMRDAALKARIEKMLSDTRGSHKVMSASGYVKSNAVYGSTML
jgi:uncharacterized membrane protein